MIKLAPQQLAKAIERPLPNVEQGTKALMKQVNKIERSPKTDQFIAQQAQQPQIQKARMTFDEIGGLFLAGLAVTSILTGSILAAIKK